MNKANACKRKRTLVRGGEQRIKVFVPDGANVCLNPNEI